MPIPNHLNGPLYIIRFYTEWFTPNTHYNIAQVPIHISAVSPCPPAGTGDGELQHYGLNNGNGWGNGFYSYGVEGDGHSNDSNNHYTRWQRRPEGALFILSRCEATLNFLGDI